MPLTKTEVKDILSLGTKKGRKQKKQFVAEGVRLLEEALRHRFLPQVLYLSEAMLSERGVTLARALGKAGVKIVVIASHQMETIADTEAPQGLLGLFAMPESNPAKLSRGVPRNMLICDGISDPGNLGTLIRSALAFDFATVVMIGRSVDPYSPKVVRSSAGALFGVALIECDLAELGRMLRAQHAILIAADVNGSASLREMRENVRRRSIALAVGSETDGLSRELMAQAELRVKIAHRPLVESLNAAVAGSIAMKEIFDAG